MRPQFADQIDMEIRRIERRRHWQRVRLFLGWLAAGLMAWWLLVEVGLWLASRLRGWLGLPGR